MSFLVHRATFDYVMFQDYDLTQLIGILRFTKLQIFYFKIFAIMVLLWLHNQSYIFRCIYDNIIEILNKDLKQNKILNFHVLQKSWSQ